MTRHRNESALQPLMAVLDQASFGSTIFLMAIMVGRWGSKEELGLLLMGHSLFFLFDGIQQGLLTTLYTIKNPSLSGDQQRRYLGNMLLAQITVCASATLLVFAASTLWGMYGDDPSTPRMLLFLSCAIGPLLFREFIRRVLFASMDMPKVLILDVGIGATQLIGTLLLGIFNLLTAASAYAVMGGACAAWSLGAVFLMRSRFDVNITGFRSAWRVHWSGTKWVFGGGLMFSAFVHSYPWLLSHFRGLAEVGELAACRNVVAIAGPVFAGMSNYFTPRLAFAFADGGTRALRGSLTQATAGFVVLLTPFIVVMSIFGNQIVAFAFGGQYGNTGTAAALLSLNLLITALGFLASRCLFILDRAYVDFIANAVALALSLTLSVWLTMSYGLWGNIIGLVLANSVALILRKAFLDTPLA